MKAPAHDSIVSITPSQLAMPAGHYAHAVRHGTVLYLAGQLPGEGAENGGSPRESFVQQMASLLHNCELVLRAGGSHPSKVLTLSLYLTDLRHWDLADRLCAGFFGAHRPARTVLGVSAIRKGYAVQASLTAVVEAMAPLQ